MKHLTAISLRSLAALLGLALMSLTAGPTWAQTVEDLPTSESALQQASPDAFELHHEVLPADSNAELTVAFRPVSVVGGAEYRLGDLATVTARDGERGQRLETLILGKSPTLGRRLMLNPRQITMDLARIGITENDAVIEIPQRVIVEREVQEVDLALYQEMVRDEVTARVGSEGEGVLVLRGLNLNGKVALPAGSVSHELSLRMPSNATGSVSYVLQLLVDGKVENSVHGNCMLDREVDVLETSRGMARGDAIQPSALKPARRLLSEIRGVPLTGADLGDALSIKRSITEGDVLTWVNVERQMLIRRGETVRMVLDSPSGIQVATVGRAEENGCLGDLIGVMNLSSRRIVRGVVLNRQVVRVPF